MLTLKRLVIHKRMSEETTAFNADVYWKGKLLGPAENTGKGGMTHLHVTGEKQALEEASAWAKAQPFIVDGQHVGLNGEPSYLSLDEAIDEQVYLEDCRKTVRRLLKTKVVLVEGDQVRTMKLEWRPEYESKLNEKYPKSTILNTLSEDDAVSVYAGKVLKG